MTALLHSLGVPNLAFHDVFSIDEPELLAFVPRPASALLLVFPVSKSYEVHRIAEDKDRPEYGGSGESEPVIWFRQTIGNSCGLMGVLHAATNGAARDAITEGSTLNRIVKSAIPLKRDARAQLLYDDPELEAAHAVAGQEGDTAAPQATDEVELHYVAFVAANGHLWELDGRRKGPIDRGAIGDGDALSDEALNLGPRKFIAREMEAGGGEVRFSLVALGPAFD
jgi:ubiquitin carboxyl-terminal hydrolase L3